MEGEVEREEATAEENTGISVGDKDRDVSFRDLVSSLNIEVFYFE
jgi:hypothetical protein